MKKPEIINFDNIQDFLSSSFDSNKIKRFEVNEFVLSSGLLNEINEKTNQKYLLTLPYWSEFGSLDMRIRLLKKIVDLHPHYIEFLYPYDLLSMTLLENGSIPIVVFVDYEGIAKIDFESIIDLKKSLGTFVAKIIVHPNSITDLLEIYNWVKKLNSTNQDYHIFVEGDLKEIFSLFCGDDLNNFFSDQREDLSVYNLNTLVLTRKGQKIQAVKVFDVLNGDSIKFTVLELNNIIEFTRAFPVFKSTYINSLFVFPPFQSELYPFVEEFDSSVSISKNISLIRHIGGVWKAYDIYYLTFQKILKEYSLEKFFNVYIEGLNSVVSSLVAVSYPGSSLIRVRNRNFQKIEVINSFFPKVEPIDPSESIDFDLIFNCVPFGEGDLPNILPVPKKYLDKVSLIIDIPLVNNTTRLIEYCSKNSVPHIDGSELIIRCVDTILEIMDS